MGKEIKITVVEPRATGGMIHYIYQLCTALANEGATVTLVTALDYELESFPHNFRVEKILRLWPQIDPLLTNPPRSMLGKLGRKIFWFFRRAFRAIRLITEWFRLTNYLIKTRPTIVQFGVMEFAFESLFLGYMKYKGLLLSQICHEFERRQTKKTFMTNLDNRLSQVVFNTYSAIFLHGETNRKLFLSMYNFPPEQAFSIEHGNEQIFPEPKNSHEIIAKLKEKYQITDDNPAVVFFGNITPSKGIPDLIKAFSLVHKSNKKAKLIIAGMPSKQISIEELENLIKSLELSNQIFLDARYLPMEEIGPLMQLANVVVYPYRNISQSGALQVAYAFGRPIIATNVGGFPDAVENEKSGLLVPPESPEQLASAILRLIENPKFATEMGKYAKHLSETRFAWPPIAKNILNVYTKLSETKNND